MEYDVPQNSNVGYVMVESSWTSKKHLIIAVVLLIILLITGLFVITQLITPKRSSSSHVTSSHTVAPIVSSNANFTLGSSGDFSIKVAKTAQGDTVNWDPQVTVYEVTLYDLGKDGTANQFVFTLMPKTVLEQLNQMKSVTITQKTTQGYSLLTTPYHFGDIPTGYTTSNPQTATASTSMKPQPGHTYLVKLIGLTTTDKAVTATDIWIN